MSLLGEVLVVIGLLMINAFFVLAEIAIVKVRASRVEEMIREGAPRAELVKHITDHLDSYLSVIQLGVTMAGLGLGWVAEPAVAQPLMHLVERIPFLPAGAMQGVASVTAFVLITYATVTLAELAPKYLAIDNPAGWASRVALPLRFIHSLLFVPTVALNKTARFFVRMVGIKARKEDLAHSEEELKILLAQSQEQGSLPLSRLLLFENLFDFSDAVVKEVMTPIQAVNYLSVAKSWSENMNVIRISKRTRYPLGKSDLSEVLGFVHVKDILLSPNPLAPDLVSLAREVIYFRDMDRLEHVMAEMRRKRVYLAMIRNAAGQTVGLITLEDLLEDLVGEIHDEFETMLPHNLSDIVLPDAMELKLEAPSREKAIEQLLQKLCRVRTDISYAEAWEGIWKRESRLTSAIGKGVAIPHCRMAVLDRPVIVFGRCAHPIDFKAHDKKPVRLIFLILTPSKEPGVQLRVLAKVAGLGSHEVSRKSLTRARTPKDVIDILQAFDQAVSEDL